MKRSVARPFRPFLTLLLVAISLAACGDDGAGPATDPGFLVGNWSAVTMLLVNQANPAESIELIEVGATFTFDVQASGRYTAILSGFGQSSSESGTVSISGDIITIRRMLPDEETSVGVVTRLGNDVRIESDSRFDFNLDGTPEAADLTLRLTPRQ